MYKTEVQLQDILMLAHVKIEWNNNVYEQWRWLEYACVSYSSLTCQKIGLFLRRQWEEQQPEAFGEYFLHLFFQSLAGCDVLAHTDTGSVSGSVHLLFRLELGQVQIPVLITDDPLLIFLQLLLGLCVQTSLHELRNITHHRHRHHHHQERSEPECKRFTGKELVHRGTTSSREKQEFTFIVFSVWWLISEPN